MALPFGSVHLHHRWNGDERTSQPSDRRKQLSLLCMPSPVSHPPIEFCSVTTASSGSSVLPEDRLVQIGLVRTFRQLVDTSTTRTRMPTASTAPTQLVTTSTVPSDSTGITEVDLVRSPFLTFSSLFGLVSDCDLHSSF